MKGDVCDGKKKSRAIPILDRGSGRNPKKKRLLPRSQSLLHNVQRSDLRPRTPGNAVSSTPVRLHATIIAHGTAKTNLKMPIVQSTVLSRAATTSGLERRYTQLYDCGERTDTKIVVIKYPDLSHQGPEVSQ